MKEISFGSRQPSMFRDLNTGLVWKMVVRDAVGAIYQDTQYKAQMRLADSTLNDLVQMHWVAEVVTESRVGTGNPLILATA